MVKNVLLVALGLTLGGALGFYKDDSGYLKGRLSACQEIIDGINRGSGMDLLCIVENKEVFVTSKSEPSLRVTLDGRLRQ